MRKIDWKVAFAALGLHWLAVIAAYCVMRATTPGTGTLLAMLEARFTTAGDAPHYLFLATEGYQATGEQANLIVFYPLYPLLMRLLSFVTGNAAISGVLISQISFSAASVVLFRLIEKKNRYVAVFAASAAVPVVNTALFIVGCLCMQDSIAMYQATAEAGGMNVLLFILVGLVTFNFFIELAVNLIVAPALNTVIGAVEKRIAR